MNMVTLEEWRNAKEKHNLWLESRYREGVRMEFNDANFDEIKGNEFEGAKFNKAILRRCTMVGKSLYGASFAGIEADDCRFDNIATNSADWSCAQLSSCSMRGATMMSADFRWTRLHQCTFEGTNFCRSNFQDADIFRCNMTGCRTEGANLILAGQDVRGYLFYAFKRPWNPETGQYYVIVKAGCRDFTLAQASKHWGSRSYKNERSAEAYADCLSLVRRIREVAKGKGWI